MAEYDETPVKNTDNTQTPVVNDTTEDLRSESTYTADNLKILNDITKSKESSTNSVLQPMVFFDEGGRGGSPTKPADRGSSADENKAESKKAEATDKRDSTTADGASKAEAGAKDKSNDKSADAKEQKEDSPFTEKYDKEKAAKLIKDLGSDSYKTREDASRTLRKMGPEALPDLEKATKSDDAEVRRRARDAMRSINNEVEHQKSGAYNKVADQVEKTIGKAGISPDNQLLQIADPNGDVSTIGPSRVYGEPKAGKLGAEDRKAFEDLVKAGDKLSSDPSFAKQLAEAKEAAMGPGATEDAKDKYVKLAKAGWAADARNLYARALSASDDPKDHQKGVELMTEQLKRGDKPDWGTRETAARLGADQNPAFMEAYKKAGGDVDKLKEEAESHRESKARRRGD